MAAAPGYYPDPAGTPDHVRYWDGAKWDRQSQPEPQTITVIEEDVIPSWQNLADNQAQDAAIAPLPIIVLSPEGDDYSDENGYAPTPARTAVPDGLYPSTKPYSPDDYEQPAYGVGAATSAYAETLPSNRELSGVSGFPTATTAPVTPYTPAQLKRQYKAQKINRVEYKRLRKEAESKLSNTRFTSRGGLAFTVYLLSYPVLIGLALWSVGAAMADIGSTLASLDFAADKAAASITKLQGLADLAPEYNAFRQNFIIAVLASSLIPMAVGIFGTMKRKGRVWGVATILLSLVFNPAIILFGAPTNLSWWVLGFGF